MGHQLTVNFRMNLFASTFECGTDFVVTHVQDSEGCGTIYIYICDMPANLPCHGAWSQSEIYITFSIVQKVWLGYLELFGFLAIINMQASQGRKPKDSRREKCGKHQITSF
jgi:hypothetical protein